MIQQRKHLFRRCLILFQAYDGLIILTVLLFLLPIWLFKYFPTQDGPSHLANAMILKGYDSPSSRYHEYYWINWSPLPNWTCYAALAALSHEFSSLTSEKILLTVYLCGFAFAFRYFLGFFERPSSCLVVAGFMLAFNRCLWLGFYNYCLSVPAYLFILGYILRRLETLGAKNALVLCLLFLGIFFTHLVGFLLTFGSCVWIAIMHPAQRCIKVFWVVLASVPALLLTLLFYIHARFFTTEGFGTLGDYLKNWITGKRQWEKLVANAQKIDMEITGISSNAPITLGLGVIVLFECFILFELLRPNSIDDDKPEVYWRRRFLLSLGLILSFMYFLLPNILTIGKGGFLRTRIVILPLLLWLGLCREPTARVQRFLCYIMTLLLVIINFASVTSYIREANRDLAEFTAGMERVGNKRILFFSIPRSPLSVNPMIHAGDYYCLETGNINLDRHFASTLQSPVRLHPGIEEGNGNFEWYANRDRVEVVIYWDPVNSSNFSEPSGFQTIFSRGRLRIFERKD